MSEPNTANIGLVIPNTGDLVGTWGSQAVNPDMVAIDGLLGGVVSVTLSNAPVTLTAPAGIAATAGPTQSQNAVLQFAGALTANVTVTLPLPGIQTIANFTTGNFVVTFRAVGSGEVIATPQGSVVRVYNDGANVKFVNDLSAVPGKMDFLSGVSALPAWITTCTKQPYLLATGGTYNFSDYPALGALYGSKFGGNGITTFGVPDMAGRVPLAYDSTGARITTAGCGIDGQSIGASGGLQNVVLTQAQAPSGLISVSLTDPGHQHNVKFPSRAAGSGGLNAINDIGSGGGVGNTELATTGITATVTDHGGDEAHNNVQPALVAGVWIVKT